MNREHGATLFSSDRQHFRNTCLRILSRSTSHRAGSLPGTRETLKRERVLALAPMELMVGEIDKESVS